MYKQNRPYKSKLTVKNHYYGERIESKIARILTNKEPIKDTTPRIYQERGEGINPQCDIRSDRFDLALEASDSITASHLASRENNPGLAKQNMDIEKAGETSKDLGGIGDASTQATK